MDAQDGLTRVLEEGGMVSFKPKNNLLYAFRAASEKLQRLVLLTLVVSIVPAWGDAQSQSPMQNVALQNGIITAVHQTTFQIDGRTFSLAPDVVILNEKGLEAGPDLLVVTAEVKYRVKKEHTDQIDRIIVFLPR